MQGKKNRKFRSILQQYELNFGFRPPYNIILDGNFLHASAKIGLDLPGRLYKIFQNKMNICVTSCIQSELKSLGMQTQAALELSYKFTRLECKHFTVEPSACILTHIGRDNEKRYIVGTCDPKLMEELQELPNVPVIRFINSNVLDFMKLSPKALQEIELNDKGKYLPSEGEMLKVKKLKKTIKEEKKQKIIEDMRRGAQINGVQLKKRAKGPNPLSVKKKKKPDSRAVDLPDKHDAPSIDSN